MDLNFLFERHSYNREELFLNYYNRWLEGEKKTYSFVLLPKPFNAYPISFIPSNELLIESEKGLSKNEKGYSFNNSLVSLNASFSRVKIESFNFILERAFKQCLINIEKMIKRDKNLVIKNLSLEDLRLKLRERNYFKIQNYVQLDHIGEREIVVEEEILAENILNVLVDIEKRVETEIIGEHSFDISETTSFKKEFAIIDEESFLVMHREEINEAILEEVQELTREKGQLLLVEKEEVLSRENNLRIEFQKENQVGRESSSLEKSGQPDLLKKESRETFKANEDQLSKKERYVERTKESMLEKEPDLPKSKDRHIFLEKDDRVELGSRDISSDRLETLKKDSKDVEKTTDEVKLSSKEKNVYQHRDESIREGGRDIEGINSFYQVEIGEKRADISDIDAQLYKNHSKILIDENVEKKFEGKGKKIVKENLPKELSLKKRFWFIRKTLEDIILNLPRRDWDYTQLNSFLDIDYEKTIKVKRLEKAMKIELFFKEQKHSVINIEEEEGTEFLENAKIIFSEKEVELFINEIDFIMIEQANQKKIYDPVLTSIDEHPFPLSSEVGILLEEVDLAVFVDTINVALLVWGKFYQAYSGLTPKRAVEHLLNILLSWIELDSYRTDITSLHSYYRVYRYIRWEAERFFFEYKDDGDLTGNLWVERLIFRVIGYLEENHYDVVPIFKRVDKLDEFRPFLSEDLIRNIQIKFRTNYNVFKEEKRC